METWYIVYNTNDGQSVSIGTVLADPLPSHLTAQPLSQLEADGLLNGLLLWDPVTGSLIEKPSPIYTPEEWVGQYFTNLEVIALMRLEQAIISQGKTLGPKMETSKQWLESMMFAQPSNNFPAAPFSYAETSGEAAQTLSSN
jgi:hypothetical protein